MTDVQVIDDEEFGITDEEKRDAMSGLESPMVIPADGRVNNPFTSARFLLKNKQGDGVQYCSWCKGQVVALDHGIVNGEVRPIVYTSQNTQYSLLGAVICSLYGFNIASIERGLKWFGYAMCGFLDTYNMHDEEWCAVQCFKTMGLEDIKEIETFNDSAFVTIQDVDKMLHDMEVIWNKSMRELSMVRAEKLAQVYHEMNPESEKEEETEDEFEITSYEGR